MTSNYLLKLGVFTIVLLVAAGCGGKSDDAGEVVPIERVCAYEKWKTVAVEGYLAPETMRCQKSKKGGVLGCTMMIYANADRTGAGIPVYFMTVGWLDQKHNRIEDPESYTGLPARAPDGNPPPRQGLRIYDNDENLIPANSKVRVFGELPKADRCEFGLVGRVDRVS